jgi:hypothetical protein
VKFLAQLGIKCLQSETGGEYFQNISRNMGGEKIHLMDENAFVRNKLEIK